MRITTQMLNETARRTGIPINQNTLLDYINNDGSGSSGSGTLLDALDKNQKVSSVSTENYKKLGKAADSLKDLAEKLSGKGEESFFDKIKESGETDELYKTVEDYVAKYNSTLAELKKSPGVMNQYYGQMLQEAAEENSSAFEKIGIKIGKDGALSIDREKLKGSSIEDIEKVFGASGEFTSKTAFLADKISDNALAAMESVSSQYNNSGSLYSQFASQFDFWG